MSCLKPIISIPALDGGKPIILKLHEIDSVHYLLNYKRKEYQFLPCRNCNGCKLDNAKEWSIRAYLETKTTENNYFITLTYNDYNLPRNKAGKPTIRKDDLLKFIKAIRNEQYKINKLRKIKYLACAEYGSKFGRPHYHICIFGLEIKNLIPVEKSPGTNEQLFISPEIGKHWMKGIHKIGLVTLESAGYTARYTLKKRGKNDDYYKERNLEPEKLFMSQGIGKEWYQRNANQIYEHDYIPIKTRREKPPRYFDREREKTHKEQIKAIKIARAKNAEKKWDRELEHQGKPFSEILGDKQREINNNQKLLKRQLKKNN